MKLRGSCTDLLSLLRGFIARSGSFAVVVAPFGISDSTGSMREMELTG